MAFEFSDLTNFYNENKDSDLGKFVLKQGSTLVQNQISNFTKTGSNSKSSSRIIPTPVIQQVTPPITAGMDNKTIYMIVGGAVALVAIIVLIRK